MGIVRSNRFSGQIERLKPLLRTITLPGSSAVVNMSHLMVNVTEFEIIGDYIIRLVFDDKTEQTINFEPVLQGYYLGPLRDLDFFNQVRLDPDFHTLVWPNGADFDPATLYNWHRGDGEELAKQVSRLQKA